MNGLGLGARDEINFLKSTLLIRSSPGRLGRSEPFLFLGGGAASSSSSSNLIRALGVLEKVRRSNEGALCMAPVRGRGWFGGRKQALLWSCQHTALV